MRENHKLKALKWKKNRATLFGRRQRVARRVPGGSWKIVYGDQRWWCRRRWRKRGGKGGWRRRRKKTRAKMIFRQFFTLISWYSGHGIHHINSLVKFLCRKALLTSICLNSHPFMTTIVKTDLMLASLTIALNVSLSSSPGHWLYPFATR